MVMSPFAQTASENRRNQVRPVERLVLPTEAFQVPIVGGDRARHQVGQRHKQDEQSVGSARQQGEPEPSPQLGRVLSARRQLEHSSPASARVDEYVGQAEVTLSHAI